MIIGLLDYNNTKRDVFVGEEEELAFATIQVISGDEVLHVLYKDGSEKTFDSSDCRIHDFNDGSYVVFAPSAGVDLLHSEEWLAREDSYFTWKNLF